MTEARAQYVARVGVRALWRRAWRKVRMGAAGDLGFMFGREAWWCWNRRDEA